MSSPVPTPLPSFVKTGRIVGKSQVVDVDTNTDVDTKPDATYPVGATYEFVPSIDRLIFPAGGVAGPEGYVEYLKAKYTGVVNDTGEIVTVSGGAQLYLPANKGQNNDQDWFWTVTPTVDGRKRAGFRMDITADVDNDITNQMPIPAAAAASAVARGLPGAPGANGVNTPPPNTPDGYIAASESGAVVYVAPATTAGGLTVVSSTDKVVVVGSGSANTVTLASVANQTNTTADVVAVQLSATSSGGEGITYTATNVPAGLRLNPVTGLLYGTPTAAGSYAVTVTATDDTGATASRSFTWTLTNVVTLTAPGNKTATVGTAVSVQLVATDTSPAAVLTWSATGLPAGLTLDQTGKITGSPTATQAATNCTVTVTDGSGATASTTFKWTVSAAATNTVTVNSPGNQTNSQGGIVSLTITATTSSGTASIVAFAATGLPTGLTMNSSTGVISGPLNASGSFSTTVTATDSTGATGQATFTWTVTAQSGGGGFTGTPTLLATRGSAALGSSLYAIPSTKVIYVDPANGVDTRAGTAVGTAVKTINKARQLVADGGTVVIGVAAATYTVHESVTTANGGNAFTIQNYPGATVWWEGAVAVTGWTSNGNSTWTHTGVPYQFYRQSANVGWRNTQSVTAAPQTNSGTPLDNYADLSDQVFLIATDGTVTMLTQIADGATPAAGQFSVNYTAGTITIGTDPTGKTVKVSDMRFALTANSPVSIQGIGFRFFSPDYWTSGGVRDFTNAMVIYGGTSSGSAITNCIFRYSAVAAISARVAGVTVASCLIEHCNYMGVHGSTCDGFTLKDSILRNINEGLWLAAPNTAAAKITDCIGLTYWNNEVADNNKANGLWIDVSVVKFAICHNYVHGVHEKSIHVEDSAGGLLNGVQNWSVVAGNIVDGGRWNFELFVSDHIWVMNNLFKNATYQFWVLQKDRVGNTGNVYLPQSAVGWDLHHVTLANNIVGPGTPSFTAQAFSSFDSLSADAMTLSLLTNQIVNTTGGFVQWGTGQNTFNDYSVATQGSIASAIAAAQTAHPLIAGNSAATIADSAATPIPSTVSDAIGVAANTKHMGPWITG